MPSLPQPCHMHTKLQSGNDLESETAHLYHHPLVVSSLLTRQYDNSQRILLIHNNNLEHLKRFQRGDHSPASSDEDFCLYVSIHILIDNSVAKRIAATGNRTPGLCIHHVIREVNERELQTGVRSGRCSVTSSFLQDTFMLRGSGEVTVRACFCKTPLRYGKGVKGMTKGVSRW